MSVEIHKRPKGVSNLMANLPFSLIPCFARDPPVDYFRG